MEYPHEVEAGWTPLHCMAQWGYSELIDRLLRDGCNPDVAESNGGTALHRAADTGDLGIAEILLGAGATVNAINGDLLETPFDCALRKGHMQVSESLRLQGGRKYHELEAV